MGTLKHHALALFAVATALPGASRATAEAPPPSPAPVAVVVDDPLLAPMPPAPREVSSWAELHDIAAAHSSDLAISAAQARQASGRWRQSLAALLPNASLSTGVGYDVLHPDSPIVVAGSLGGALTDESFQPTVPLVAAVATARQTVVDVPAFLALAGASASERGALAAAADARRRVLRELARSTVVVVTNERTAELARTGLRQALERAALTQRLFELGTATHLDVVRVRQDVAVARSALIGSDESLRRAREDLGAALGVDGAVGVAARFAPEGLVQAVRGDCEPVDKVQDRDDVAAARAQADAAAAARREAWSGYLPSIDVATSAGAYTSDPGPGRFGTWTLSAVLSIPLWEGGRREGVLIERSAVADQADATVEQVERDAALEEQRARHGERAAAAVLASAQEAHALAAELDRLTRRSFEIGRADSLDLVQSGAVLRQAQTELAVREALWLQSRLDVFFTLARCHP